MPIITLSPPSPPPSLPTCRKWLDFKGFQFCNGDWSVFLLFTVKKIASWYLYVLIFFFFFWQIMDEADRILNLDFEKEVGKLCKHINSKWLWNVVSSQSAVKWQLMNYGNCQIWSDGSTRMSNPNFRAKVSQVWKM